uniref:Progestin and adipoQ receptor family member 4 n=1 Tax=Chelonoidis abingdonii TaxID=106734 RepID=A0A8C0G663_CHEAB
MQPGGGVQCPCRGGSGSGVTPGEGASLWHSGRGGTAWIRLSEGSGVPHGRSLPLSLPVSVSGIPLLGFVFLLPLSIPWARISVGWLAVVHYLACVVPQLGSVLYHLFMNHEGGPAVYHTLLTLDMCGVCMVNTLGALPIIYCTLACSPLPRSAALLAYTALSSYAIICAVTAHSNVRRLRSFAWQALFRFFFFYLRWAGLGTGHPSSLRSYLIMDGLALLGGVINISRVPERWQPGRFDYWFNSHQIMHVLVVVSILYLHWGVVADLLWVTSYACPQD